ncbi:hypothetical protein DMB66_18445 [Actinoplanes sp. ATCC 53533]|uniref:hypothetical protein n=1 Tax=Actinoplanes sp. ATCC 53533 TaxID=1288362 RepID=UPI000F7AAE41|nr:hypothetical protein [Actinoplanes sp. ATCC 53533]RSM64894.1 hypothetical protein DMB66_18445 [Actinoplanes sp. ATCC 53533]
MPLINWSTVWTAGATALLVTLLIEYAAKPRLEARKEAILDAHRARREVRALVMRLTHTAQRFAQVLPDGVDPKLAEWWKVERNRCYDVMAATALQLVDGVERYAGVYRDPLLTLIQDYAYAVHGVRLSARQRRRQTELIVELGSPMLSALDFPAPWKWWRFDSWDRSVKEVRRLMAQLHDDNEPATEKAGQGG